MRIEEVEAELRRKLERLERIKRRLKKLEEEERRLLKELSEVGDFRGSIVSKYVRCGKKGCKRCPHGPYYYLVWKESGKVKWKYIGEAIDAMEAEKRSTVKMILRRLREIQREKKRLDKLGLSLLKGE